MLLDDVVHVLAAEHERRAEVEREDALDVVEVLLPPGVVEVELALEVPWTASGTARSDYGTDCPPICRIIMNVKRITSRITGTVQNSRRR